jgi:hypothetical protein
MIFAKLDVCIPNHPKFIKAGPAAVGYWAAALAYTRGHELDGILPAEAVGSLLGLGVRAARKLAEVLVEVGLFERIGDGYLLANYSEKNETKAAIETRRAAVRERVEKFRGKVTTIIPHSSGSGNANVTSDSTGIVTPTVTRINAPPCNVFVPGSGSDSDSDSDQKILLTREAPEATSETRLRRPPESDTGTSTAAPEDILVTDQVRLRIFEAAAPSPTREDIIACLSHHRSVGTTSRDWGSVLVKWMINQKKYNARQRSASIVQPVPVEGRAWTPGKAGSDGR